MHVDLCRSTRRLVASRCFLLSAAVGLIVGATAITSSKVDAAPVTYHFYMDVVSPRTSVCLGEKVSYIVTVNREPVVGNARAEQVAGVTVEADVEDPSVGSFAVDDKGRSQVQTGFDLDPFVSVHFQFTAGKKPGKTTLQFQGKVGGVDIHEGYVSFAVPIDVKVCSYKVTTVTRFPANGKDNPDIIYPPIVIRMLNAIVTADSNGDFTGTGMESWIGSSFTSGCRVRQAFGDPSPVLISGSISGDLLVLTLRYQPVGAAALEICGPITRAAPLIDYQEDELDVELPSAGGTITHAHTYGGKTYPGSVVVTAVAVKQ